MSRNPLSALRFACYTPLILAALALSSCDTMDRGGNPWATPQPTADANSGKPGQTTGEIASPTTDPNAVVTEPIPSQAKVALLLPLSGRGSDVGQAMLNAAQLAMFDLNATNLFQLMPQDTGKGADQAISRAMQGNANLVLGPLFSDNTKVVGPLALQHGINVVSFSTDTSAAMGSTFLMGFVPQTQIEQVLAYAATSNLKSVAIIAPRDTYGDAATATFYGTIQRLGLMNAGIIRYDTKEGMAPNTLKAQIGTAQAVLIAAPAPEAAKISTLLTNEGLPPVMLKRLGTGLWDQADAAKLAPLQGAWYAASSPRLRARFEQRYFETYGQQPPRLASLAYDATALAVVLAKSGRGYGRDVLTNASGFAGIDGIFRFGSDGLAERGLAILEINNGMSRVIREAPSSFTGQ